MRGGRRFAEQLRWTGCLVRLVLNRIVKKVCQSAELKCSVSLEGNVRSYSENPPKPHLYLHRLDSLVLVEGLTFSSCLTPPPRQPQVSKVIKILSVGTRHTTTETLVLGCSKNTTIFALESPIKV